MAHSISKSTEISRKIRLRQVRCFVTVARRKSFVLAADELGLTQPAVSRSVRELEELLGHALIDRSTRGAELTSRGRSFIEAAEVALSQLSLATETVVAQSRGSDTVRVGALPNVCSQFLPSLIKTFKQEHPEIAIRVIPGSNAGLLAALRRGEADFVIGRLSSSEDMKGLAFEALFDEPLIFVVRKGHPLENARATVQVVLDYPLLLPPEGTIIRQEVSRFLAANSIDRLPDVIETTSSDFQRAYLEITDAIAAVPRGVLQGDIERGNVHQLDIGSKDLTGPVGLTVNPTLGQSSAVRSLLSRIRSVP